MSGVEGQGLQEAGEQAARGRGGSPERPGARERNDGAAGRTPVPRPPGSSSSGNPASAEPVGPGRRELGAASEVSARGWPPRAPSGSGRGPGGEGVRRRWALQPHRGGGPSRPRPAALTLHRRGARADGGAPAVWPRVPAPLLSAARLVSAALLSGAPPAPSSQPHLPSALRPSHRSPSVRREPLS